MIPAGWKPGSGGPGAPGPLAPKPAGGAYDLDFDVKKISMKLTRKTGYSIRMDLWEGSKEFALEEEKFYELARHPDWTSARSKILRFRRIEGTNEFFEE